MLILGSKLTCVTLRVREVGGHRLRNVIRTSCFLIPLMAWIPISASALQIQEQTISEPSRVASDPETNDDVLSRPAGLAVRDVLLEEALLQLRRTANIKLGYSPSLLPRVQRITCLCEDATVGEALSTILAGTDLQVSVLDDYLVIRENTRPAASQTLNMTQTHEVRSTVVLPAPLLPVSPLQETGTVLGQMGADTPRGFAVSGTVVGSNDNGPRAGVSVHLKGTNTGVLTVPGGGYQITARSAADTLVFTFLGYSTEEVAVAGRAVIEVTLRQSVLALQEIIVQGYGTQARELVSGSVSQVGSDVLEGSSFSTVSESLMGLVQGVNVRLMASGTGDDAGQFATIGTNNRIAGDPQDGRPGAPAALEIRNMGAPLYLIDNVPASASDFNNLNPADIETVSLLRDAAAAVYGFRAANGVVLVQTKRGDRNSSPVAQISGYYGAQNPTSYHFEYMVNAYEYQHSVVDNRANLNSISGTYSTISEISPQVLEQWRIGGPGFESYNYYDIIMNNPNAPQYGADMSVSGGTTNSQFRLSIGHTQQDYIIKDPTWGRTTIRANVSANLTDRFLIGTELSVMNAVREDIAIQGYQDPIRIALLGIHSNLPIHRPFVGPNNDLINYDIRAAARSRTAGQISMDVSGKSEDIQRTYRGNLWAEYTFPFGTKLRGTVNASTSTRAHDLRRKIFDMYTTNQETGEIEIAQQSGNRDRYHLQSWDDRSFMSLQASQSLRFGGHSLTMLGFWEREGSEDGQTFTISISPTDYSDLVNYGELTDFGNSWGISRRASMGTRVDYDYNQKYLVTLLGRYDGTHLYAPGKRWGFFPGITMAWRVTEEGFMRDRFDFLDEMKIRASWGETGSESATAWAYLEGATYGQGNGAVLDNAYVKGVRPRGLPVTNVTWVTNTTKNLGMDLVLMNGKLSAEVDYFERLRSGIPASRQEVLLPSELGYGLPEENLNADITRGMEAIVTWSDQIGNVRYSVSPNMTIARTAPHYRYGQEFGSAMEEYTSGTLVGRWDGTNFGFRVLGQFEGFEEIQNHPVNQVGTVTANRQLLPGDFYFEDVNGDGIINNTDQRPMGYSINGTPILSFGAQTRVVYGNMTLTANFAGGAMFSNLRQFATRELSQGDNMMAKYSMDRWMHADPYDITSAWVPGKYPPLRRSGQKNSFDLNSDFWRTNVRFIRIRRVELGYVVPNSLASNLGLSGLRVYTNIQNPVTFDNMSHINMDPEVTQTTGLVYPTTRLVTVGFSATIGGR